MMRIFVVTTLVLWAAAAGAQPVSQRGFIEGREFVFPQTAPNDATRQIGDVLFREEVFLKPANWIQFAAGLDLRANSHDQTEHEWRLDFADRSIRRPAAAVRRLSATISAGPLTIDVGKQFIRWARADVLNPEDRFAPRDYLNVIDTEVLPVLAVRPSLRIGSETFEAVWSPRLTPSRLPLLDQRWSVFPQNVQGIAVIDAGSSIPKGDETGVRWTHVGRIEAGLSYFNGFNHLPSIESSLGPSGLSLLRVNPALRSYGGDLAIPTRVVTLKGEMTYFTSPDGASDEYVLYVIEFERQAHEWVLVAGYAGESVTKSVGTFSFAPDRGIARSVLGRATYTVDPRRTVAIEAAVRQNGDGVYVKGEYSQAFGRYFRLTWTGVGIGGQSSDFLGQFNRNSHGSVAARFSF